MKDYITLQLDGSFLKNAGICGFMKFLEMNEAVENDDYKMHGQELKIRKDYLTENNIPEMYINSIAEKFEKGTKFYRVITDGKSFIDKYYKIINEETDDKIKADAEKKILENYKEFEEMMLKNSFKATYDILKQYDDIEHINADMITDLKKTKDDFNLKYQKYCNIIRIVNQKIIKVNLVYTELLYTKFRYFFAENSTSHKITSLDEKETKREDTINKNFYQPMIEEFEIEEKKKKSRCIECMEMSKNKRAISFMTDTADDLGKKKSYYWNCQPDAYVCPVCAFIYLFVPLGFAFLGADAVFVNSNSSVNGLKKIMSSYEQTAENSSSFRQRVYRIFTSEKLEMINEKTSNFQVIVRSSNFLHYEMNVIDSNLISKLYDGRQYLEWLEKKYVKFDEFISVYDKVFENILAHRTQYPLIDRLIKHEFANNGNFGYIKYILNLQIIFNGGADMEDLKKKVEIAFAVGRDMRKSLLGENAFSKEKEDDNTLRGFVYRLVNLASVGDTAQFLDTVIRVYSGYNLTIPGIFKDCYSSEEAFKAIAHGFILGLKYVKYEKKDGEDNKNE